METIGVLELINDSCRALREALGVTSRVRLSNFGDQSRHVNNHA